MPVGVMLENDAVQLVGPALGDDVDRGAAREALLGVEVVGRDVHRLDRLGWRHVEALRGKRSAHIQRAIQPGVIAGVAGAVDVRVQRASG